MNQSHRDERANPGAVAFLVAAFAAVFSVPAFATNPAAVGTIQDMGIVNPETRIGATLTLKSARSAEFDSVVANLYDPSSPSYHQWMSTAQVAAYGPSQADLADARTSLGAMGLRIDGESADGIVLRVSGSAARMQAAFGTTIHQLKVGTGMAFRSTVKPVYQGAHHELVAGVTGLAAKQMTPFVTRQMNFSTGKPLPAIAPQAGTDPLAAFMSDCFKPHVKITPGTYVQGHGTLEAAYEGPGYLDVTTLNHPRCGYTARQVVSHHGVQEAHAIGWSGKGQTIVIVDAYGSPTMASDLNTFSQVMGLRSMSGKDFEVVYSDGQPSAQDAGWATETTLDVEWAHAIAPDARIVLVVAPSPSDADLAFAVQYAVEHHLGDVISNSWGIPESEGDLEQARMFNAIMKAAAARGIAVNFATGDSGDNGVGTPVGAAIMPADSPFVTAVGGTSINVPTATGPQDTAWGLNVSVLAANTGVAIKPIQDGFQVGGGGGESVYLAKPGYQRALQGVGRQTPDISALADPETGAIVVQTDPSSGLPTFFVVGGTSLATPIFSGIWAIANQAAGESLGQAAPVLGKLPAYAINDVLPIHGKGWKVSGSIAYEGVTTAYAPDDILGLDTKQKGGYVSALNYTQVSPIRAEYFDLGFGLDSSLVAQRGWDNATGYGVPNGLLFIEAARQFARQSR